MKEERLEPKIEDKLLDTITIVQEIFDNFKQALWIMGSMAIAAHLGKPHRTIDNDVDFITTNKAIDNIIDHLEANGYIVEEGWGNKIRIYNTKLDIRCDIAIFNKKGDYLEVNGKQFSSSGFPNNSYTVEQTSLTPISKQLLYAMKYVAYEESGRPKHEYDLKILESMIEKKEKAEAIKLFSNQCKFDPSRTILKKDLIINQRIKLSKLTSETKAKFKNLFIDFFYKPNKDIESFPEEITKSLPPNVIERIIKTANLESTDIDMFKKYIYFKLDSYLSDYIERISINELLQSNYEFVN